MTEGDGMTKTMKGLSSCYVLLSTSKIDEDIPDTASDKYRTLRTPKGTKTSSTWVLSSTKRMLPIRQLFSSVSCALAHIEVF